MYIPIIKMRNFYRRISNNRKGNTKKALSTNHGITKAQTELNLDNRHGMQVKI